MRWGDRHKEAVGPKEETDLRMRKCLEREYRSKGAERMRSGCCQESSFEFHSRRLTDERMEMEWEEIFLELKKIMVWDGAVIGGKIAKNDHKRSKETVSKVL